MKLIYLRVDGSARIENAKIGPNAYIGPYTAIGDRCQITAAETDDSIVMEDTVVDVERKLVRSMVGKGSKILNANGLSPKGQRLVVGENTTIYLCQFGISVPFRLSPPSAPERSSKGRIRH